MTALVRTGSGRRARTIVSPLQPLRPVRLTTQQQRYLRMRRWADVILGGLALVLAALPMLVIAGGVMATMGRPVLFTQERMTQDGRIFRLRKFRSMRAVGPDGSDLDADRLVPFGRFLRATSLDELPSLWNVVRGDMSLVGPRPLTSDYHGRFSADQFARHAVPAGLTGYAQVNGRNALGWDDRLGMDQEYVGRVGPLLDLRILVDTVSTVLRRHGVTDESGVTMADFPGPQSMKALELEGPDELGCWVLRDSEGRTLLEGAALVLDGDVARLELRPGPVGPGVDLELLDEAILLLVSRLRATHRVEWGCLATETELPAELAAALSRAGFVAPNSAVRFPTKELPPVRLTDGTPPLIAFLGLPEDSFARSYPTSHQLLERAT